MPTDLLSGIGPQGEAGFIRNFTWDGGELDALMWDADRLAVVEVSSGFIPNASKMSGDHQRLRAALSSRCVESTDASEGVKLEAVAQLARDIEWLLRQRRAAGVANLPLNNIETIHPVLIAADRTLRTHVWRCLDSELRQRLPDELPWQVAPLAVMGLEDLEWIEQAVQDRHARLLRPRLRDARRLHLLRHGRRHVMLHQMLLQQLARLMGRVRARE